MVKKSSKIRKPIRQIFLKLKLFDKSLPLLNKTLLYTKLSTPTLSVENELTFMSKVNPLQIHKTIQNTTTSTLGLLNVFMTATPVEWTLMDFRQNYLLNPHTVNWIWHNSFTPTLIVLNQLNTKFNTFFYKNYNLFQQMSTAFSTKIFYQNHFFTRNRSTILTASIREVPYLVQTHSSVSDTILPKNVKKIKQQFLKTFQLYRQYFLFIAFTKTLSRWNNRRPIYSHLFSKKFLMNRFLITITSNSKTIPYWKRIHQKQIPKILKISGVVPFLVTTDNDNFFENNFDNQLIRLLVNTTKPTFNVYQNQIYTQLLNLFSETAKFSPNDLTTPHLTTLPLIKNNNNRSFNVFFQNNTNFAMLKNTKDELLMFQNPLLFKFFFWNTTTSFSIFQNSTLPFLLKNHFKTNPLLTTNPLLKSNLVPLTIFQHTIRRKVIKLVVSSKYLPRTTTYFYRSLIQFMEFYTGKKVYLKFNPFIENSLTYSDLARCYMWFGRVNPYQRILGHRIFVHESLRIFHLALRFKDPTFLSNWIKTMLYRMSFWKYRVLFRYIKYVLRNLFWAHFDELDFKGIKLTLRGKISVAGNARTRTLTFSVGKTSHSEMNNRVLSDFTNIHSFTGVMGFRLSFYF